MAKIKIKATSLDAFKWTGVYVEKETPKWLIAAMKMKGDEVGAARIVNNEVIKVVTERGIMTAFKGDYILRDSDGVLYPLNPRVLELLGAESE